MFGGLGCSPHPNALCTVGRRGLWRVAPPPPPSFYKGFWVSVCPPRSPSCPQDMSTFSRPQWGWYIPHSVLGGRVEGKGRGGGQNHTTAPFPSGFPIYRGAALTCTGGPWCQGCCGRWNRGRPPTSAPCSPLGRYPPPPPTAGGDKHPRCPLRGPQGGGPAVPDPPHPHLTWGSPNSTRTLPRSCSSPTRWNQSGGKQGVISPPICSLGRGAQAARPPPFTTPPLSGWARRMPSAV